MKISTMKWIDRWFGLLACGLLRVLSFIIPRSKPKQIERILVIKFWGMGSLILSLPVFKALRSIYPEAKIGFATLSRNQDFLELLKISDYEIYLKLSSGIFSQFGQILLFFFNLRRFSPEVVIDLEYLTRFSALASYFSGAGIRVGFHSWDVWRGNLHNIKVSFNPYWHISENFLNLVQKLVGREFPMKFDFTLAKNQSALERLRDKLRQEGFGDKKPLIVINPNASTIALERRWPMENFVKLIELIVNEDLGYPVLIGSIEERGFVEEICSKIKNRSQILNLAGKLKLDELIELIRGSELLITNDSGPLHLAGLLGTKTVSFFGPETPVLFGPIGRGHQVLFKGIDCSPCISVYNAKTVRCIRGIPECLSQITPEEALLAVKEAVGKK